MIVGTPGYIVAGADSRRARDRALRPFRVRHRRARNADRLAPVSCATRRPRRMTAILRDDPPPLGRAVPGLPAGIAGIIERCLDKHPSRSAGVGPRPRALPRSRRRGEQRICRPGARSRPRELHRSAQPHSGDLVRAAGPAFDGDLGLRARDGRSGGHGGDRRRPDAGRTARPACAARSARDAGADRAAGRVVSRAEGAVCRPTPRRFATTSCPTGNAIPDVPLLVALGPDGRVIASTDEASAGRR